MSWPAQGAVYDSLESAKRALYLAAYQHQIPIYIAGPISIAGTRYIAKKKYVFMGCSIDRSPACSLLFRLESASTTPDSTDPTAGEPWIIRDAKTEHSHSMANVTQDERLEYAKRMQIASGKAPAVQVEGGEVGGASDDRQQWASEEEAGSESIRWSSRKRKNVSRYINETGRTTWFGNKGAEAEAVDSRNTTTYQAQRKRTRQSETLEVAGTITYQRKLHKLVATSLLPFPPTTNSSLAHLRLHACAGALQRNFTLRVQAPQLREGFIHLACSFGLRKGDKGISCDFRMKIEKNVNSMGDEAWEVSEISEGHTGHQVWSEVQAKREFEKAREEEMKESVKPERKFGDAPKVIPSKRSREDSPPVPPVRSTSPPQLHSALAGSSNTSYSTIGFPFFKKTRSETTFSNELDFSPKLASLSAQVQPPSPSSPSPNSSISPSSTSTRISTFNSTPSPTQTPTLNTTHSFLLDLRSFLYHLSPSLVPHATHFLSLGLTSFRALEILMEFKDDSVEVLWKTGKREKEKEKEKEGWKEDELLDLIEVVFKGAVKEARRKILCGET